jgi:putative transposase
VRELIESVQTEFPFYGYRRLHEWLERKRGVTINEKKILRIMKKYGLKAMIWRGWKIKTTDPDHNFGYAKNLLPGRRITGINQVWVTDITYIRIRSGFVYLAVILDLFSRRVVGWAISLKIDTDLCLTALDDAIKKRQPKPGLIHHSDRGVQGEFNWSSQHLKREKLRWENRGIGGRIGRAALHYAHRVVRLWGGGIITRSSGRPLLAG